MRQNARDKRNYIIIGLLLLVLFMTVGFAAFSTNLQINGTANISTNWCVGFDNTKTSTYEITKGKASGTNPTATMGYSGTACSTNYVPIANLGATFYQPGDKIEYTLTIANKGSIDAAIESITVDGTSVTSNQTITKGNIIWKVYMPESTTLPASTGTTTMVVSAEFQNTTDLTNYTSNERQTITIGVNAVQGTTGMDITPSAFTGTIYRNNTKGLINGFPMEGEITIYYPSEFSSASEAYNDGWFYASQAACTGDGNESCASGTVTLSPGAYETTASNLNKTYYLKHEINNGIVESSYVCFVTDTERCMQGGNSSYYAANKTLLQSQESWFNSHSGSCSFGVDGSYCYGGGFYGVDAYSDGIVHAGVSKSDGCRVYAVGNSYCKVSDSGGSGSGGGR